MGQNAPGVPVTIGRFRIDGRLGAGGMGEVYKGFDPALMRSVAVKTVRPDMGGPEFVERLYREAQACARLQHPHIVTIYEVGEFDGGVFIAMEFLKGQSLAAALESGTLTLAAKLRILCEILEALAHAHAEHVVHRDIKPSNVHLLPDGAVKLLDFGLARIEQAETITLSGAVMGTPHYASPEQLRAERVDARSDIFSTGALAYELFDGHRPFEADTISAVLIKVLTAPPAPTVGPWANRFPPLASIVLRAMAKSPAERYGSATEMRAAVMEVAETLRDDVAAFDAAFPPTKSSPQIAVTPGTPSARTMSTEDRTNVAAPVASAATAATRATGAAATRDDTATTMPPAVSPAIAWMPRGMRSGLPWAAVALVVVALSAGRTILFPRAAESSPTAGDGGGAPAVQPTTPSGASPDGAASVADSITPSSSVSAARAVPSAAADASRTGDTAAATMTRNAAMPAVPSASADATRNARLMYSAGNGGRNAGLKFRVVQKLASGDEVDVDPEQTFHSGDRVRLVFESNLDGFLYVAMQGSSSRWTILFPGPDINGGTNAIGHSQDYQVPNNGWFRFDETPGTEQIFVVFSRERLAQLPGFRERVTRPETLSASAVDDLKQALHPRDLMFEKDPPPPAGNRGARAQYIVNRDELGTAVSATIALNHAQ